MTNLSKHFIALLFAFGLSGCASLSTPEAAQNKNTSWLDRTKMLSAYQQWNMHATIGIRTRDQAESASLVWQQNEQNYSLLLFGPLGTSTYKLSGKPGLVELQTPEGKILHSNSPETLLAEQTGWKLPISNLYYWVRGLPVPGLPAKKQFDAYHHLIELDQQGWKIEYLRYMTLNQLDLPSKMSLTSETLSVKIIIQQW